MAYIYDITKEKDLQAFFEDIDEINNIFESMEFKKYIAQKCKKELDDIMERKLSDIPEYHVMSDKVEEYKKSHIFEVDGDFILRITNSTTLTQDEMYWVSDSTKARYPEGISISYAIEYGTGLRGFSQEDWQVNVPSPSKHPDGKWTFKRDGIVYKNVSGLSARFIYEELLEVVQEKFRGWTEDYIEEKWRK